MNSSSAEVLELRAVTGHRGDGERVVEVSAAFAPGRFHVLRGPAGCGRDLLLRLLGLLQTPEAGDVLLDGSGTRALAENARAELRTQRFGFVFSAPFLLSSFSVIENVAMPLFKISQVSPEEARQRTETLLDFVGLAGASEVEVEDLSLSAQFHVALARGLINEPSYLLVENLDGALAGEDLTRFIGTLRRVSETRGTTIIATATQGTWPEGTRILEVAQGRITLDSELLPEMGS